MLEVEVFGAQHSARQPTPQQITDLCARVADRLGVGDAHVAVQFVDAERMAALNARFRDRPSPTDVLSFPIDGVPDAGADTGFSGAPERGLHSTTPVASAVPQELGDIVICMEHTADVREAVVHGMLHLLGMDHETDDGEMLAVQRELLAGEGA
jgi:probable rRNA maturation factor